MTKLPLNDAMLLLAAQPNAIFLGQGVASDGVSMHEDYAGIPMTQRIELPVVEELQMGMGIGLSLMGFLPILQYPRMDFLLRAMDQLCLHLDKLDQMSRGQFKPKVIVRTRVGSKHPLNAGPQHTNNFSAAFQMMLTSIVVDEITRPEDIMSAYGAAIRRSGSTIVVENIQ